MKKKTYVNESDNWWTAITTVYRTRLNYRTFEHEIERHLLEQIFEKQINKSHKDSRV